MEDVIALKQEIAKLQKENRELRIKSSDMSLMEALAVIQQHFKECSRPLEDEEDIALEKMQQFIDSTNKNRKNQAARQKAKREKKKA